MFALEMTVRVLATVAIGMLFIHMHGLLMERFRHQLTRWEPWTAGVFLGMAAVFAMIAARLVFEGPLFDGKLALLGIGAVFYGLPAAAVILAAELAALGLMGELTGVYPAVSLLAAAIIGLGLRRMLRGRDGGASFWPLVILGVSLVAAGMVLGYLLRDPVVLGQSSLDGALLMLVMIPTVTTVTGGMLKMEKERRFKEEALLQTKEDLTAQNEEITALYEEMAAAEETLQEQFDQLQAHREEILRHNERYKLLYQAGNEGLWEYDYATGQTTLSDRLTEIYGYGPEQKVFMTDQRDQLIHPEDLPRVYESWRALERGQIETYDMEYRILHASGEYRWIRAKGTVLRDESGRNQIMAGSHGDIHLRKTQEQRLYESAYTDSLTGLKNRRWLMEKLEETIQAIVTDHDVGAVLMLGLDDFKSINEAMGMRSGDEILRETARRLETFVSDAVYGARLGGDEFILTVSGLTQRYEIEALAQQVMEALHQPISFNAHQVQITASMGIVLIPKDAHTVDAVLRSGDMALSQAKAQGRGRYTFFDERMAKQNMMTLQLDAGLKAATLHDELALVYQPIFNVQSGRLAGFEALVRWNSPEFGYVSPAAFIRIAEKNGQIVESGAWVVREACRFLKSLPEGPGEPLYVSVNVSTVQIMQKDFILHMQGIISEAGVSPERLIMEITETALMESFEASCEKISVLRAWGVGFSLDDFGTGYSSLNYLRKLPVSTLKLDKCFIDELLWDERQRMVVKTIIDISHQLAMTVVAEGVEEAAQMELLRELGCDCIQGYHLGRPVAPEETRQWIH